MIGKHHREALTDVEHCHRTTLQQFFNKRSLGMMKR